MSEKGRYQAFCAAKFAKTKGVSAIYSSTANRALETADIIAETLGLKYEIKSSLKERNYGPFEGLNQTELFNKRQSLGLSNIDPTQDWEGVPEVESDRDIWARVYPLFQEISAKTSGYTVLFVTHAGVIKAILHSIFEIPPKRSLCFRIPGGCIVVLRSTDHFLEMMELCPNPCLFCEES